MSSPLPTVPPVAAVVFGGSAGGMEALRAVLAGLPATFPSPILVVNHLHGSDRGLFATHLGEGLALPVTEAFDKQAVEAAHVYVAPADYHLLVERDQSLALSVDPKVKWSRPSIDVTFESAARVWLERLVGVVLSGANDDGADGALAIRRFGGRVVAQDPATALQPAMPRAAIERAGITDVLAPADIAALLLRWAGPPSSPPISHPVTEASR